MMADWVSGVEGAKYLMMFQMLVPHRWERQMKIGHIVRMLSIQILSHGLVLSLCISNFEIAHLPPDEYPLQTPKSI
jgi:hypothetical protein